MFNEKDRILEDLYTKSLNRDQLLLICFSDGRAFVVKPDTWFTDENDYDETDERYEEWECGVFEIQRIISDPTETWKQGDLVEITSKNFPSKIIYDYQEHPTA